MTLTQQSPCKVNFLLNILGKRADGFHELETVMHPIPLCDQLEFQRIGRGVQLSCSDPSLPADSSNLVHRAATAYLQYARISDGVRIHLEKRSPMAAGLGGGSSNAAHTLLALNELWGRPIAPAKLSEIAAGLGSDVPFFLQSRPALATGRGERVTPLEFFPALRGTCVILIHPGFGVSTPWAYRELAQFPEALNGKSGRAGHLISLLGDGDLAAASGAFYNSLEAPALRKYPILGLFQEFLRANGAAVTLMSGSGSTTFALVPERPAAERLVEHFKAHFGASNWTAVVSL